MKHAVKTVKNFPFPLHSKSTVQIMFNLMRTKKFSNIRVLLHLIITFRLICLYSNYLHNLKNTKWKHFFTEPFEIFLKSLTIRIYSFNKFNCYFTLMHGYWNGLQQLKKYQLYHLLKLALLHYKKQVTGLTFQYIASKLSV